jgi:hypothetical protein
MLHFLGRVELEAGISLLSLAKISSPARGQRSVRFPWGSWAETKSATKDESLLGEELDLLILGEASQLPEMAWERRLYARLGSRKGSALALSTPNWDSGFFRDLYERGVSEDEENQEYASWKFSVLANPSFDFAEYYQAREVLDSKVFAEQYDGEFTSRRGIVFAQFEDRHFFGGDPDELQNWPTFRTWYHYKSGYNNPFICLCVAMHPGSRKLWVWAEIYQVEALVGEVLARAKELTVGRKVILNLATAGNQTLKDNLKSLGSVSVLDERKYSRKHAQVRKIQVLQTAFANPDTEIFIAQRCNNLIRDLQSCKWPEPRADRDMAEPELPTTKHLGGPMALAELVAWVKIAQYGEEYVYKAQYRRR